MSQDLVPLSYNREAYNAHNGTELREHNDILTAEQAKRINDYFDIEVHVGVHGITNLAPDDPDMYDLLPTQREYQEAADVVENMQPGDTLFIEASGFDEQLVGLNEYEKVYVAPSYYAAAKEFGGEWVTHAFARRAIVRRALEEARKDYRLPTFQYAERLARLRGIRTHYADNDAFEGKALATFHQGRSIGDLVDSEDSKDQALAGRINTRRERKARNVIKDYALENLPPVGTPVPTGRKPKLVLLFGGHHAVGLDEAFNDLGLDAKIIQMYESSPYEREVEIYQWGIKNADPEFLDFWDTLDNTEASGEKVPQARTQQVGSKAVRASNKD